MRYRITITIFLAILITSAIYVKKVESRDGLPLPIFSLEDPDGRPHGSSGLYQNGLVLVVTAPTLKNEGAQKGWSKYLPPLTKNGKPMIVFIEDMSPSDFKKEALKDMKKDFREGSLPLLLIDQSGNVTRELGVASGQTEVLVYNKKGKEVYRYTGAPSAGAAATIVGKAK